MATKSGHLTSSESDANPSAWVHLAGSNLDTQEINLDTEIRATFKEAWQSQICSDLTLCTCGEEFKVHKLVLAAHSPYLKQKLVLATHSPYFKQKLNEERIAIDLQPEILRSVLIFLYEGEVDVPKRRIHLLKQAAEKLQLGVLQRLCHVTMLEDQGVTEKNCMKMWTDGCSVKNDKMATRGLEMALKNAQTLMYNTHFLKLPLKYLQQYILHKRLNVPTPDGRLSALVKWIMHDPDARLHHMAEIMDHLPMSKMQIFLLQETMHNPIIAENQDVCYKLKQALKYKERSGQWHVTAQSPGLVEPGSDAYFRVVTVGHQLYKEDKWQDPSDEVIICKVGNDIQMELVGHIGTSHVFEGTKCIVDGNTLYAGCLGKDRNQIWQFHLDGDQKGRRGMLGESTSSRQHHAMCLKYGLICLLGGSTVEGNCTASVDVLALKTGSCTDCGTLRNFNILDSKDYMCNLTCHSLDNSDCIAVCGAFPYTYEGQTIMYQHTIQVFSISQRRTTHSVILDKKTEWPVYSLLELPNNTFIILAYDYTAVISVDHIEQHIAEICTYSDKYTIPNEFCGVVLTPNKEHVLLLGGHPKRSSPSHYVYQASVQDILSNTGSGWKKVEAHWPLGKCLIYMSNTMDIVKC